MLAVGVWSSRLAVALLPLIEVRVAQFTFSDVFALVALLALSMVNGRSAQPSSFLPMWFVCGGFILSILLVVSQYNAVDRIESAANALKLGFGLLVFPGIVWLSARLGQNLGSLIWAYAAGNGLATLSALAGIGPSASYLAGDVVRLAGLAGHPVGLSISSGVSIAMLAFLPATGPWQRLLKLALVVLAAIGIATSVGVTGAVIAVAGIIAGIACSHTARGASLRALALLIGGVGLIVVMSLSGGQELLNKLLRLGSTPTITTVASDGTVAGSTLDIRLLTWEYGIARISESPVVGNGLDIAGQVSLGNLYTHNYVLLAWQTVGLAGLVIASVVTLAAVWALVALIRYRRFRTLTAAAAAGVMATLLAVMTSPALYGRVFYFLIAFGVVVAVDARSAAKARPVRSARMTGMGAASR